MVRLLALALLFAQPAAAVVSVADELRAYYEDGKREPDWRGWLKSQPEHVVALLEQALADELSGAAPWRATPYWGSSGENPARELRRRVAEHAPLPTAVVRWFLDREQVDAFQESAFKQPDPSLLSRVIDPPHGNAVILARALTEAGKRKLPIPPSLFQHHRKSVREAARAGRSGLPPFDPVSAVQAAPIAGLMQELGKLIVDEAPPSANLAAVTRGRERFTAWILAEDAASWTLLTAHGRVETLAKDAGSVAVVPVEKVVKRVVELRRSGDKDFALSENGGLTGQFEGHGAGLEEALLAHWLHRSGRFAPAAAVLLPALDTLYRDERLLDVVRLRLGDHYGQELLVAFAGDRDYARAQKLASTLTSFYRETRFFTVAQALAVELPRRKDDFGSFRLPTPAEWEQQKKPLTRAQQIDFLVERLRLLNCFQMGQPGGVSYDEKQTREPQGMARDASWGLNHGKTEVINPWKELTGALTVADIALLAPHLRDDWLMPTVSFWRDFHPDREVHHTRAAVAQLIDGLAKAEIVDGKRLAGPERDQEIERLRHWAQEHGQRSENDLLLEAVAHGKRWYDVEEQARTLTAHKDKRALPLFRQYLLYPGTNEYNLRDILALSRELDAPSVADLGKKFLSHSSLIVRVEAAQIVLVTGDKTEARGVLVSALESGDASNLFGYQFGDMVAALLADGARAEALRLFANPNLPTIDAYARAAVMRRFIAAGMQEPFAFYERMLAMNGHTVGGTTWGDPIAQVFADELIDNFDELQSLRRLARGPARVAAARRWLAGRAIVK
jgi:hypothetical protein